MKNTIYMAIKKIIAIASAKGGVGKSSLTAAIASSMSKKLKVGILDADIYGPNQHILFNLNTTKPKLITKDGKKLFEPVKANLLSLNSMGFILDDDKAAIWRGPMLSGAIRQLMNSTDWGDLDYLFIDMPPGTGDAYLTVAKEIKPDYSILIATGNKLAIHDVHKSIAAFEKLNIKILGFIENNTSNHESSMGFESLTDLNIKHIGSVPFDTNIFNFNEDNLPNSILDITSKIQSLV